MGTFGYHSAETSRGRVAGGGGPFAASALLSRRSAPATHPTSIPLARARPTAVVARIAIFATLGAPMPSELATQLDRLPADVQTLLKERGFDRARFEKLAARLGSETADVNRVTGRVTPPAPGDLRELPEAGSKEAERLEAIGLEALARGECALCVLAGGMATRMGGVVKALVEAVAGTTFLDLRLAEAQAMKERVGRVLPLWLMTSHSTDQTIRESLGDRVDGDDLAVFTQHLSLRLTENGDLYLPGGRPDVHAPGHGDLPDALRDSGILSRFVQRGGRAVMTSNIDSVGATVDPLILGWHLDHGKPVTCEVVDKVGTDRGGIPVRMDDRPVVLEEFRLPRDFDPSSVRVFNTNTFLFDARALLELEMDWTFFTVRKKAQGNPVIQFERLIGEVTSHLDAAFLRVPRAGAAARFIPVKDNDELERRRGEIEAVARARGMLRS